MVKNDKANGARGSKTAIGLVQILTSLGQKNTRIQTEIRFNFIPCSFGTLPFTRHINTRLVKDKEPKFYQRFSTWIL